MVLFRLFTTRLWVKILNELSIKYLNGGLESLGFNRISVPYAKSIHVRDFTSLAINTPGCVTIYCVLCL